MKLNNYTNINSIIIKIKKSLIIGLLLLTRNATYEWKGEEKWIIKRRGKRKKI